MHFEEAEILEHLVDAHNLFIKLEVQHPQDHAEWCAKLHDLQRIIMAREAVRNNPTMFVNEDDPT